MNYFDGSPEQSDGNQVDQSVGLNHTGDVRLPDVYDIQGAVLERLGPDLQITAVDGDVFLIPQYFVSDSQPFLLFSNGMRLPAHIVEKMVGPRTTDQYAQATDPVLAEPIGTVETLQGNVEVLRADGTRVTLSVGDPVFQGDELITDVGAAVSIIFADETTFALGEVGRMVLDEMVYDPGEEDGAIGLTLINGAMTFVSGAVAKVNPDAMVISTPVATIGIRGTAGVVRSENALTDIGLMAEADGFVGEVTVTAPNGDQITINVANGLVTASALGLSDVVIGTTQDLIALGGNGLVIMAQAGLVAQSITQAIQQQIEEQTPLSDEQEVELNAAEEAFSLNDFLGSFQSAAFETQSALDAFARFDVDAEIQDRTEIAVADAVSSFQNYDTSESLLNDAITAANQASATAAAAESNVTDATDETSASVSLLDAGFTDTASIMDIVYSNYDAFGAALAISNAASSIAELANAALYTTGEDISAAELEELATQILEAANQALEAANSVNTITSAIISGTNSLLQEILDNVDNFQSWITSEDDAYAAYAGMTLDEAAAYYAGLRDYELINSYLSDTSLSLADVPNLMDPVINAVSNANEEVGRIQENGGSNPEGFLGGFSSIVSNTLSFVTEVDSTTTTAYTSVNSEIVNDIISYAQTARSEGIGFEQQLLALKNGVIASYKSEQLANIDARVLDTAADTEQAINEQQQNLSTTTAEFQATLQVGDAVDDYLTGLAETNLANSQTAFATAQTNFAQAQQNLQAAIGQIVTASGSVLQPLIERTTALVTRNVFKERSDEALDNVQENALEEVETAFELSVDTLYAALQSLESVLTEANTQLVGSSVETLDQSVTQMDDLVTLVLNLRNAINLSGQFNGTNEQTSVQNLASISTLETVVGDITALETLLSSARTDLNAAQETSSVLLIESLQTALGLVKTALISSNEDFKEAFSNDVEGATTLSGSVDLINVAVQTAGESITSYQDAISDVADDFPINGVFAQNSVTLNQADNNATVLLDFAQDLTGLWVAAFNEAIEDTNDAQSDFEAKDLVYQNALSAEETARTNLADRLVDFQIASTNLSNASRDLAFDETYLEIGRAQAEDLAENQLSNLESQVAAALEAAKQAAATALDEAETARLASQATGFDSSVTQQSVLDIGSAQSDAEAQLVSLHEAIVEAAKLNPANDDLPDSDPNYFLLAKASPPDWQDRFAAMEAALETVLQITKVQGETYTRYDGTVVNFVEDGTLQSALEVTQAYDDLADAREASNVAAVQASQATASQAATQSNLAQIEEAAQRVEAADLNAQNALVKAAGALATALASATVAFGTPVTGQINGLLAQVRSAEATARTQAQAASEARQDLAATNTVAASEALATSAEAAANAAQTAADNALSLAKDLSTVIIDWAEGEIQAQLNAATQANSAAQSALGNVNLNAARIDTNFSPIDDDPNAIPVVTQQAVNAVENLVGPLINTDPKVYDLSDPNYGSSIVAQTDRAEFQFNAAETAANTAQSVLDIAVVAGRDFSEFSDQLESAAQNVGAANTEAGQAQNAFNTANKERVEGEIDFDLIESILEAREQQLQAEADAQAAADEAAALAQADADAEVALQEEADADAANTASFLADQAEEAAEQADAADEAARDAALNADLDEVQAQYDLAEQFAQVAQSASDAAGDAAAGHGQEALDFAEVAASFAANAQASLASALVALNLANNATQAANDWRSGAATTALLNVEDRVEAAETLLADAQLAADEALETVDIAKFGDSTTPGAIALRVEAAAAEAVWISQQASEGIALDRLNTEIASEGLSLIVETGLSDLQLDNLDLSEAGAKEVVLRVWVDAYKAARAATLNADQARLDAEAAATSSEDELSLAEQEAENAVQASLDVAAQLAEVLADQASATTTQTLGRLTAEQQGERASQEALDDLSDALTSVTAAQTETQTIAQTLELRAQIEADVITQNTVDQSRSDVEQAQTLRDEALSAQSEADAALIDAQAALEDFYVELNGLPVDQNGTPIGDWLAVLSDGRLSNDANDIAAADTLVALLSETKYDQVLANLELAQTRAEQVNKATEITVSQVSEAEQFLETVISLQNEANLADEADYANILTTYEDSLEQSEGSVESAVQSLVAAVEATKDAVDDVILLIDGASIDENDTVSGAPDSVVTAHTSLQDLLVDLQDLSAQVENWSEENTNPSTQEIEDFLDNDAGIDIGDIVEDLEGVVTEITTMIGDLDSGSSSETAAQQSLIAVNASLDASEETEEAAGYLQDIKGRETQINATNDPDEARPLALESSDDAQSASLNAAEAAKDAITAQTAADQIVIIQNTQAQETADQAAAEARTQDYDAVLAARDRAQGVADQALSDVDLAQAAYDAALQAQTEAQSAAQDALVAATFEAGDFEDQEAKTATEQANDQAQNSLGLDENTATTLNVTSEVARALSALRQAQQDADVAVEANDALNQAVIDATDAFNEGESVTAFRQEAETNAQTVLDQQNQTANQLDIALDAQLGTQTARDTVVEQRDLAIFNRQISDVSEAIADQTDIAQNQLLGVQDRFEQLQSNAFNANAQAQIAADNAEAAADKVLNAANPATVDLSLEQGAADAALNDPNEGANARAEAAQANLDDILLAQDLALDALNEAQTTFNQAGNRANSFAQDQLDQAQSSYDQIVSLRLEATQTNNEAQEAALQAQNALSAIEAIIDNVNEARELAGQARATAIESYESEAEQSALSAEQALSRGQTLSEDVDDSTQSAYTIALDQADGLLIEIDAWLALDANPDQERTDLIEALGNGAYSDLVDAITALRENVDNSNNSLQTQITTAHEAIFDENTGALKQASDAALDARTQADIEPRALVADEFFTAQDVADSQAAANGARTKAEETQTQIEIIEAQRARILSLIEDIDAVTDGFDQLTSEAEAQAELARAELEALQTPIANDDILNINEDETDQNSLLINLLSNDSALINEDGDVSNDVVLRLESVGETDNGTIELLYDADGNTTGVIRYTPNEDFNGTDTFSYTISNGLNKFSSAEVTVNVAPQNDPPIAVNDFVTVANERDAFEITPLLNDIDVDGDDFFIQSVNNNTSRNVTIVEAGVTLGVVTWELEGTRLFFTPNEPELASLSAGEERQFSFDYAISDGTVTSANATITLSMTGTNDAPVVNDFSTSISENSPYTFDNTSLFTDNFVDVDAGDSLQSIRITKLPYIVVGTAPNTTEETSGTLSFNGQPVDPQQVIDFADIGNLIYTPANGYVGDVFFEWTGSDGRLSSEESSVVTLDVIDVNDPPIFVAPLLVDGEDNTDYILSEATLLALSSDPDPADTLEIRDDEITLRNSSDGTIAYNGDNTWTFSPAAGFSGAVIIDFIVTDGTFDVAASANFDILFVNDPPVAQAPIAQNGSEDSLILGTVSLVDPDGDALTYRQAVFSDFDPADPDASSVNPQHGSVVIFSDGSFEYTPDQDYNGPDSFFVLADDGNGGFTPQKVEITVDPVNDAPENLGNTSVSATTGGQTVLSLSNLNYTDVDGDSLTFTLSVLPTNGQLSLTGTTLNVGDTFTEQDILFGYVSYQHDGSTATTDSFSFDVSDGIEVLSGETVSVGLNTAPEFIGATRNGISFDGVDDYISVPDDAINDLAQGTIETWVYTGELGGMLGTGTTLTRTLGEGVGTNAWFGIGLNDGAGLNASSGTLVWSPQDGVAAYSTTALTANTWHHVAVSFDSNSVTFYIDGVQVDSYAGQDYSVPYLDPSLVNTGAGDVFVSSIGGTHDGNFNAQVDLDDTAIWDTVRSPSDIFTSFEEGIDPDDPALRLYYDYEDFDLNDAFDVSTITPDYSGTLVGDPTFFGEYIDNQVQEEEIAPSNFNFVEYPQTVIQPDGSYGVFYFVLDGSNQDLYGQLFDKYHNKVGSEFKVNDDVMNVSEEAADINMYVTLGDTPGDYILTYSSNTPSILDGNIYLKKVGTTPDGPDLSNAEVLIADTADHLSRPGIGNLGGGNYVVSWDNFDQVIVQVFNESGAPVGSSQIFGDVVDPLFVTNMKVLNNGDIAVVMNQVKAGNSIDVLLSVFSYDVGSDTWTPRVVESSVVSNPSTRQGNADFIELPNGNLFVVWVDNDSRDSDGQGVYGSIVNPNNGAIIANDFLIHPGQFANQQSNPHPELLSDGSVIIAWTDSAADGSSEGVYGQRYDQNGTPIGSMFQINSDAAGVQFLPEVTDFGDGIFQVKFSDGNNGYNVESRFFSINGNETPKPIEALSYNEGETVTFSETQLLGMFFDNDGDFLTLQNVIIDGTPLTEVEGLYSYTPADPDFFGKVNMFIEVSDGALSTTGHFWLDFQNVNDPLIANNFNPQDQAVDTALTFSLEELLAKVTDVDNEDVIVDTVAGADLATLESTGTTFFGHQLSYDSATEIFTLTPQAGFTGVINFNYSVSSANDTSVNGGFSVEYVASTGAPQFEGVSQDVASLIFNGNENYINGGRGTSDSLVINNDLSIQTWIKPSSLATDMTLLSMGGTSTNQSAENKGYELKVLSNGDVQYEHEFGSGDAIRVTFDSNLNVNEWVRLALVRDNNPDGGTATSTVKLYVNGTEVSATYELVNGSDSSVTPLGQNAYNGSTQNAQTGANASLHIGAENFEANSEYFIGEIADLQIWSQALTNTEVMVSVDTAIDTPDTRPNLEGYWDFGGLKDSELNYLEDLSSNDNHLAPRNSFYFDGATSAQSNSQISLEDHAVSVWVRTDAPSANPIFHMASGNTALDFFIDASGYVNVQFADSSGTRTFTWDSNPPIVANEWVNIGYSFDNAVPELYINGVASSFGPSSSGSADLINFFAFDAVGIGIDSAGSNYFLGDMSELVILDAAVNAQTFADIYEFGAENLPNTFAGIWEMDQTNGSSINGFSDLSGNPDMTAPITGFADWVNEVPDVNAYGEQYLSFDGTSGPLNLGNYTFTNNEFTFAAWLDVSSVVPGDNIFTLGTNQIVVDLVGHNEINLRANNSELNVTLSDLEIDEWSYFAVTFDGSIFTVYVSGDQYQVNGTSTLGLSGGNFDLNVGSNLTGSMGEIQLWETSYGQNDIEKISEGVLTGSEPNLLANYRIRDEESGFTIINEVTDTNANLPSGVNIEQALPTILVNGNLVINEDSSYVGRLVGFDNETNDPGTGITFSITSAPMNGSLDVLADGSFVYRPNENYSGSDSFDVVVNDSDGFSSPAQTVNITIEDFNAAPDTGFFYKELPISSNFAGVDLLSVANDQDGDSISLTQLNGQNLVAGDTYYVDGGEFTFDGTALAFKPDLFYEGQVNFSFTVADSFSASSVGFGTISVSSNYFATESAETFEGSLADETIYGQNGDDTFFGSFGDDSLFGENGSDTIDYSDATEGISVNLGDSGSLQFISSNFGSDQISVENIVASSFNDHIFGSADANIISTGGGDDTITGGGGQDSFFGGSGNDVFVFNPGDSVNGAPVSLSDFTTGQDKIFFSGMNGMSFGLHTTANSTAFFGTDLAGLNTNTVYFVTNSDAAQNDFIYVNGSGTAVDFNSMLIDIPSGSVAVSDVLQGDQLPGLPFTDWVGGTSANDVLAATAADPTVFGGNGDDQITGFSGDEFIVLSQGNDTVIDSTSSSGTTFVFDEAYLDGFSLENISQSGTDLIFEVSDGTTSYTTTYQNWTSSPTAYLNYVDMFNTSTTYEISTNPDLFFALGATNNGVYVGTNVSEIIDGTNEADIIFSNLDDTISSGQGGDRIILRDQALEIDAGGNIGDIVDFSLISGGITVDFTTGSGGYLGNAASFSLNGADHVIGTSDADNIIMGGTLSLFDAGDGNDSILMSSSSDSAIGGAGMDIITGSLGFENTIIYNSAQDSNVTDGIDLINQFVSGEDRILFNSEKILNFYGEYHHSNSDFSQTITDIENDQDVFDGSIVYFKDEPQNRTFIYIKDQSGMQFAGTVIILTSFLGTLSANDFEGFPEAEVDAASDYFESIPDQNITFSLNDLLSNDVVGGSAMAATITHINGVSLAKIQAQDLIINEGMLSYDGTNFTFNPATGVTGSFRLNYVFENSQGVDVSFIELNYDPTLPIIGSAAADNLVGTDIENLIYAGDGDDTIEGGAGSDILFGQLGTDTITYREGIDEYRIGIEGSAFTLEDIDTALFDEGLDLVLGVERLEFRNETAGTGSELVNVTMAFEKDITATSWIGNVSSGSDQQILSLPNGNFVSVVMLSDGSIRAQFYDENFNFIGTEFNVSDGAGHEAFSVTATADSGFVASFTDGSGVYLSRFDSSGNEWNISTGMIGTASDFQVPDTLPSGIEYVKPSVIQLNNDSTLVVMEEVNTNTSTSRIVSYEVFRNGQIDAEHEISPFTSDFVQGLNVTALTDGGFGVVWIAKDNASDPELTVRVFDEDKIPYTSNQILSTADSYMFDPEIVQFSGGNLMVTWSEGDSSYASDGIESKARILQSDGNFIAGQPVFSVNRDPDSDNLLTTAVALENDTVAVAWHVNNIDGDGYGVFGNIVDSSGTTLVDDLVLISQIEGNQLVPSMTSTHRNSYVVSWFSTDSSFNNGLVKALEFDLDGNAYDGIVIEDIAGDHIWSGDAGRQVFEDHSSAGNDTYDGGLGNDVLDMYNAPNAIDLSMIAGTVTQASYSVDTFTNIETFYGTMDADVMNATGTNDAVTFYGMEGNDQLLGGNGADVLVGGLGFDTLFGGNGDDYIEVGVDGGLIDGGGGMDTLDFSAAKGNTSSLTVDLGDATPQTIGGVYTGTVDLTSIEAVITYGGDDVLFGSSLTETFVGGAGNDTFHASNGADTYVTGLGDDTVRFDDSAQFGAFIQEFGGLFGNDKVQIDYADAGLSISDLGFLTDPAVTPLVSFEVGTIFSDETNVINGFGVSGAATGTIFSFLRGDGTNHSALYMDTNGQTSGGVTKIADFDSYSTIIDADDIEIIDPLA